MKGMAQIIGGIVICLLALGYYGFLFATSNVEPTAAPVATSTALKMDKATIEDVRVKSLNGHIPIVLSQSDLDNAQPFKADATQ